MVTALRCRHHRAVVFAKRQQRFFIAQAFQQRQTEGLARAFVLPGSVFHAAIAEGLRLIVVVGGNERQGVGESVFAALEAGAQGVQVTHGFFLWQTPLVVRRWLVADIGLSTRRTACRRPLRERRRG